MRGAPAASPVPARTAAVGQRQLAANTLWMFAGHGSRAVVQALSFLLIARSLGSQGYGAFISVAALVAIVAPFASLGAGNLLVKHVARDPGSFEGRWGSALIRTAIGGSLLLGLVLVVAGYVLPESISLQVVVFVGISDLIFLQVLDMSGKAFQAFQRLSWTARLEVAFPLSRLAAAAVLAIAVTEPSAVQWAQLYALSTVAAAALGVYAVHRELGRAVVDVRVVARELREGTLFSVSLSAQSIYNDIDKTMLSRLAAVEAAGIYAAAYRVIDVSFTPVRSLLFASYARFFQSGVSGIRGTLALARPLVSLSVVYGIAAAVCLYTIAPALPWLLGDDYRASGDAVRWLALLPLVRVLHYFAADALTGAGFQGIRSGTQVGIAGLNVLLNLWLIPAYSWRGAALASLLSDGLLAVSLWVAVWGRTRR